MFTEGLDENAINWINQGSEASDIRGRSPLSPIPATLAASPKDYSSLQTLGDPITKSSLLFQPSKSFSPSHGALPPLRFHAGFLTGNLDHQDEDKVSEGSESVASVSYDGAYMDEEAKSYVEDPWAGTMSSEFLEEDCANKRGRVKINKRLLKEGDLRVDVNGSFRRCDANDSVYETRRSSLINAIPSSEASGNSWSFRARGNMRLEFERATKTEDLQTPSAPPLGEFGDYSSSYKPEKEVSSEADVKKAGNSRESANVNIGNKDVIDQTDSPIHTKRYAERESRSLEAEEKSSYRETSSLEHPSLFNTNGQYAWQTMISYDACIRLCLHAWARGCVEAAEFLQDECLVLRTAFGLHKFLLQPRGVYQEEAKIREVNQISHLKVKKVVEKIKVEVIKLRVFPRRKLARLYSRKSSMYMHLGKEYIHNVSTLMKSGWSSFKLGSFSIACEERMPCIFQLKSALEDPQLELKSNVCLFPGTGDYHVFYPASEGDAVLVEVLDEKEAVQGRAIIPISSLNDNPSDRTRWWPLSRDDQECVGKIQLQIGCTIRCDETNNIKSGIVVETLAYDLLLEAALRALNFHSRNLRVDGSWNWLLNEFASYYGVSDSYTKLRYLTHVMSVATPTKMCLELVEELLVPIIKAKGEKSLTRQERSLLLDCETHIDGLLAIVFENYRSLDETSPTGIAEVLGPVAQPAAPALAPAVKVYTLLHDILSQDAQSRLRNYLQAAVKKRSRKHMIETDEFLSVNTDGILMDSVTKSTAYLKMKNLCTNIGMEIREDIKLHNQHILPSSIDLSSIAAAVYSTELCNRARSFLSAWPPSSPQPYVNEFLTAIADFEIELGLLSASPIQGGVDSRILFHDYIMVWVQDMQLNLLELCKAERQIAWTSHSTSPFVEEMYDRIKDYLVEYEVVINRWPQYSLILESAVADAERAIVKSLDKQYADVLFPLKDSIPRKLNMHVQKLTRRQSTTLYSVPIQLGTLLNTFKRIIDVLHIRVEDILKSWASYLPTIGDKKLVLGEQMNGVTVLLRTKYKTYLQAIVEKLVSNTQATNRNVRLKRILEDIKEEDGETEVRDRMQILNSHLVDSISNLHEVFSSRIFVAACRGYWDRIGQIVLKFLESRKENRVWYNGSCYVLGILDDTFASQMQRLLGNALQEKDLEPPTSVNEARSILCRDVSYTPGGASYFYP